jgi:hypothetical protein
MAILDRVGGTVVKPAPGRLQMGAANRQDVRPHAGAAGSIRDRSAKPDSIELLIDPSLDRSGLCARIHGSKPLMQADPKRRCGTKSWSGPGRAS